MTTKWTGDVRITIPVEQFRALVTELKLSFRDNQYARQAGEQERKAAEEAGEDYETPSWRQATLDRLDRLERLYSGLTGESIAE